MRGLILAALACASTPAFADDLVAKNGVEWGLPPGDGWSARYTDVSPHQVQIADELPADPRRALFLVELQPQTDGTFAQVETALATELARDGVTFGGEKVASFAITTKATKTATADATNSSNIARQVVVHAGAATINGRPARYAIAHVPGGRSKASTVLVGMVKPGVTADVEKASWEWFDSVVKRAVYPKSPAEQAKDNPKKQQGAYAPKVDYFVGVGDGQASSSLSEKAGGAPAWRTALFDVEDPLVPVPKTAWCEGKPDEGIGESLTLDFTRQQHIGKLLIAAGRWETPEKFAASNKVTRVVVSYGDKTKTVELPPERRWAKVDIGWGYSAITIKIDQVRKGKVNDSCISGVMFESQGRLSVLHGSDADALNALDTGVKALYAAVASGDKTQLAPHLADAAAIDAACKQDKTRCPRVPTAYNTNDNRSRVKLRQVGTELELTFPYEGDTLHVWRIGWKGGAWKLVGFGTRPVPR